MEPVELPIACSLGGADRTDRVGWLEDLRRRALTIDRSASGLAARFAPDPDTEGELRALVAAEAACCPFLTFEIAETDGALELRVSGSPEALPVVDELFAPGAPD